MQVCILNGSPKGEKSVTMQYVRFMELADPDNSYVSHEISHKINEIERKPEKMDEICNTIRDSDLILWATPVYYQHVPAQYKRFIELLFERKLTGVFSGKYAASLTTSVHFFDQKVHEYLQGISEDLGMNYAGSFPAGMNDLLEEKNQKKLAFFGKDIIDACMNKRPVPRAYLPVPEDNVRYIPGDCSNPVDSKGKKILILHDSINNSNLEAMIRQFEQSFPDAKTFHLDEIGMKGGCLGCVQCAFENQCIYKDGFASFWIKQIEPADIIIFAGTIRDRYLSAKWKQFFDRSFFLGHIPKYSGKQVIIMVEGPLSQVTGLRENLSSLTTGANLVEIITDEDETDFTSSLIRSTAERAVRYAVEGYIRPPMFPDVGGHIVLRDAVWGDLRPMFRADHRYYKSHGLYDFPQYQYGKRINRFFFSLFMGIPMIQKRVKPAMKEHMIQPYNRIFNESKILNRKEVN